MENAIIFYSASFLIIIFGILTIALRNIFYSLLSAICVFFLTAVFFFILGSEYNAVIQLAVYGFAIPVILGCGIMFTNFRATRRRRNKNSDYAGVLTGGIFIMAVIYIILVSIVVVPKGFYHGMMFDINMNSYYNFEIFSKGIFIKYVFAFELISVILTVIAAGLTMIKRGEIKK